MNCLHRRVLRFCDNSSKTLAHVKPELEYTVDARTKPLISMSYSNNDIYGPMPRKIYTQRFNIRLFHGCTCCVKPQISHYRIVHICEKGARNLYTSRTNASAFLTLCFLEKCVSCFAGATVRTKFSHAFRCGLDHLFDYFDFFC